MHRYTTPVVMLGVMSLIVMSAPSGAERTSSVRDPSQLLVVDCLLPGQVRKRGRQMVIMNPPRPAKTTASDCEIRGGTYVAYDRANYATALQVWLPLAEAGDAAAQTYVGEIFEKGLGRPADPTTAATWYQKAADQNHRRAQANLAYLYEQGVGVSKDPLKALNLYRLSAGLPPDEGLVFESQLEAAQSAAESRIGELAAQLQAKVDEANTLQHDLAEMERLANTRRGALAAAQRDVDDLRRQLAETSPLTGGSPRQLAEVKERQSLLEARESELRQQKEQLAALQRKLDEQNSALSTRVAATAAQASELERQLGARSESAVSAKARLAAAEERVRASNARIKDLEDELARGRLAIKAERDRLSATITKSSQSSGSERARLEAEIREREWQASQQQALIAQLRAQNRSHADELARMRAEQATQQAALQQKSIESATIQARLASTEQQLLATQQKLAAASGQLETERRRIVAERQALERSRAVGDTQRQGEIERLTRELARLESDNISQKARIAELSAERSEYRTLLASAPSSPRPVLRALDGASSQLGSATGLARQLGVGEYHALIIGNNNYAYMPSLESAVNDARAIDTVLRDRYRFKTRMLMNATRAEILSALNEYRLSLRETDSLLIYYAGHGELDSRNLTGYWLPVNAKRDDNTEWISDRMITEQINLMSARHIMVVADSCYSGAMTRSSGARLVSRGGGDAEVRRLKLLVKLKSRTVLTSGGEKPVLDGGGGGHSVFARALIEALNRNSGVLEGSALYNLIFDPVKRGAAQFKVDQSPRYSQLADAGHGQGEFLFVPRA